MITLIAVQISVLRHIYTYQSSVLQGWAPLSIIFLIQFCINLFISMKVLQIAWRGSSPCYTIHSNFEHELSLTTIHILFIIISYSVHRFRPSNFYSYRICLHPAGKSFLYPTVLTERVSAEKKRPLRLGLAARFLEQFSLMRKFSLICSFMR